MLLSKAKSNTKGFSLVELLIVIAIMGVLAVIAFNAFNGVLSNSRRRADEQQAKNIERAVRMLVTETGVVDITKDDTFFDSSTNASAGTAAYAFGDGTAYSGGHTQMMALIEALQDVIYVNDPVTGRPKSYGPYLTNPRVKDDGSLEDPTYLSFAPQWNPTNGGKHVGYSISIDLTTQNLLVMPYIDDAQDPDSSFDLETNGTSNISVNDGTSP